MITNQSESKFNEMKKNFENLRQHNEKLISDLHLMKQKEIEVTNLQKIYNLKVYKIDSKFEE